MANQPRKANSTSKKSKKTTKVVSRRVKKQSTLERLFGNKLLMAAIVLVFAGVGAYLVALSNADAQPPADNPGRGLVYSGLKKATTGPCAGNFEDTTNGQSASHSKACLHVDPGPDGVDVRQRAKNIDAKLAAQADYDKKNPPAKAGDPTPPPLDNTAADLNYGGSLSQVSGNYWPCVSNDRPRFVALYGYRAGSSNRRSSLQSGFDSIIKRSNAVMYNSSVASGAPRQFMFYHNSDCSHIGIDSVAITGDTSSYSNIVNQMRAAGHHYSGSKYLVFMDTDQGCGIGSIMPDTKPTQDNANNTGNSYAVVWHGCWNYGEPHELMHTLGAVSPSAPYGSPSYHCWDQHDVMCYYGGSGHAMVTYCGSSAYIWRYDCNHNTYFDAANATGWLATHWNTANSKFLVRY